MGLTIAAITPACYDKALVDGLAADLAAGHAALVETAGHYDKAAVDALPAAMQAGLSGQAVACPSPVGPISDTDAAPDQVAENAPIDTPVGISAFAEDPGDLVSYDLIDDAGGLFMIDSVDGEIVVAPDAVVDFETAASHQVTVRATSSDGSFSDRSFTVAVIDDPADNPPPPPPPAGWVSLMDENLDAGTVFETGFEGPHLFDNNQPTGLFYRDLRLCRGGVIFPPHPILDSPRGTINLHLMALKNIETSYLSRAITRPDGVTPTPRFDLEYGGDRGSPDSASVLNLHSKIGTGIDQGGFPRWHNLCQFFMLSVRWDEGSPWEIFVNGVSSQPHTNTEGFQNHGGVIAVNCECQHLKSNGRYHILHLGRDKQGLGRDNAVFDLAAHPDPVPDADLRALYEAAYADLKAAGKHVEGEGPFQTVPAGFDLGMVKGVEQDDYWTPDPAQDPLLFRPKAFDAL